MKNLICFTVGLILLNVNIVVADKVNEENLNKDASLSRELTMVCSPNLLTLAEQWVSQYALLNPQLKISVVTSNGKTDLTNLKNVVYLSTEATLSNDETQWKMVVGRDVIVPVINSNNPLLAQILKQGVSSQELTNLLSIKTDSKWSDAIEGANNKKLQVYIVDDPSVTAAIATYTGSLYPRELWVNNAEEMKTALQKDPYAIGICKLRDVIDLAEQALLPNITLLPIDKNGNGVLDPFERIYDNLAAFNHGVWIGKYPSSLCRSIFMMAKEKPLEENEVAFLAWLLNDGQPLLTQNGYFTLLTNERLAKTEILVGKSNDLAMVKTGHPLRNALFTILFIFIGITILVWGFRKVHRKKESVYDDLASLNNSFDENSVIVPKGLNYDKSHTWTFMEKNGNVRVGMDDFLQHVTGRITKLTMKNEGEYISKGDPLFTVIQNGKHLTVYSPLSGKIVAFNENLTVDSTAVNTSPYNEGWVYLIEPTNWSRELQFMIRGDKFSAWLNNEFIRLKDFLSSYAGVTTTQPSYILMQDGGAIKDNILEDMGPEIWEDFQSKFIDSSRL